MTRPWADPDDAPELTDEWFDKATFMIGEKVIRKGVTPRGSDKRPIRRSPINPR